MSGIVQNPGIQFDVDQSGTVVLTVPYYAPTIEDALSLIPTEFSGLGRESMQGKERQSKAGFDVMVRFAGMLPGQSQSPDGATDDDGDWEVDTDLSEEPIKSHFLLPLILKYYGGKEDEEAPAGVRFDKYLPVKKTGSGRGLQGPVNQKTGENGVKNPAYGLETYFVTGAIVRRTRIMATVPEEFFRKSGDVIKRLPIRALSHIDWGNRDWLVMVPRPRRRGNAVEMVEEWKLSAPGGWPPYVYGLIDRR